MKKAIYAMVEGDCDEVRPVAVAVMAAYPLGVLFPARTFCGCSLERGSAPRDSFERLRTPPPAEEEVF